MSGQRAGGAPGQVKEVTSLANPLVKDIKALSLKKFRDQQNAFMAEGLKLVIDALDLGWSIRTLVFAKAARGNAAVEKVAARTVALGGTVLEVSEKILTAITRRDNPQAVVGVFSQRFLPLKDIHPKDGDVWVALDRVRDPGNLGTVIRTVDAVGAKGVILVGETTDPFSLETVRATMGSIFAVPVAKASQEAFLAWRKGFPGLVAGTHLKGAVDYRSVDFAGRPVLLLMGNEQQGLPDDLARSCDRLLRIPQAGRARFAQSSRRHRHHAVRDKARGAYARRGRRKILKSLFAYAGLVAVAVALDQWIKYLVETGLALQEQVDLVPFLALYRTYNTGVAFSMLSTFGDIGLIVVSLAVIAFVLYLASRATREQVLARIGFALIVGGAIGNLIDRAVHGHVIDYILFHTPVWSFAVFNLADAFITVGAIMVVADELFGWWRQRAGEGSPHD